MKRIKKENLNNLLLDYKKKYKRRWYSKFKSDLGLIGIREQLNDDFELVIKDNLNKMQVSRTRKNVKRVINLYKKYDIFQNLN